MTEPYTGGIISIVREDGATEILISGKKLFSKKSQYMNLSYPQASIKKKSHI